MEGLYTQNAFPGSMKSSISRWIRVRMTLSSSPLPEWQVGASTLEIIVTRLAVVCVLMVWSFRASVTWSPLTTEDVVADITRYEQDIVKADLANDISFYEKHLADAYTLGSSTGVFETKRELLADMRDRKNNQVHDESIHDIRVRRYGSAAIATYTLTFNETLHGQQHSATVIATDTFIKLDGQWKLAASHNSAVPK
jgi:ketosteroid isomerase-like protein